MRAADDLDLLLGAAYEAGKIAEKYFRADPKTWEKDGGQGPVTIADLEIDAMLRETLMAARPDYGWLSEESDDDLARLEKSSVFVIDPIDGTRAFVEGRETFSHSLAIAHDGVVGSAVVHLPLRGKTYAAASGNGATLNDAPLTVSNQTDAKKATILAGKMNVKPDYWASGQAPFKPHFRSSLAYRMALVGQGRFDGMLTLRPTWEWDVAAGALIIQEAGGTVADRTRAPLRFNNEGAQFNGVIAAGPPLYEDLMDKLAPFSDGAANNKA